MLSVIRRVINSKIGLIVTFVFLIMIALAFGLGDITGLKSGGGLKPDVIATIGKESIGAAELQSRAQNDMEIYRQQQPGLDMIAFVNGGGLDATLSQIVDTRALSLFGQSQGMLVTRRAVDGQIAGIPSLQGPNGEFSQLAYDQLLQQRRLTDAQVRGDIARETLAQQLTRATLAARQVPKELALPYASLLLEKRDGQVAVIPTQAMGAGTPPTDAEINTFFRRNAARYTVPERRSMRYAVVTADQVKDQITPTDAEIAAAYQSQRAKYAATEKRNLVQVVLADQASANALVAKIKGGTAIADAARAVGLEASSLNGMEQVAYVGLSSKAIADAAFAAPKGGVIGPLRSPLGFTVVRVDSIEQVAGKTLEQVKPELVAALTKDKTAIVLGKIHDAIDDAIAGNSTFDEIVTDQKLTPNKTPALLSDGRNPDDLTIKAAPDFLPVIAAAFAAEPGDDPQMVPMDANGGFAVVALDRVVPAAVPPIAKLRPVLTRDFAIDRARTAARKVAADITLKINKGMPIAQALAASGVKTPPIQPVNAARAELAKNGAKVPPAVALLFSMSEKSAKLLELPNNAGWFIVYLNHIERGNAAGQPNIVQATRSDLGQVMGREYVEQFTEAVRRQVGVKKNDKAINAVKASLTGQGPSN